MKVMNRNNTTTVQSPRQDNHRDQPEDNRREAPKPDNEGKANPPADSKQPRHNARILLLAIILLVCVASAGYYIRCVAPYESTDNAFIEGNVIPMALKSRDEWRSCW